MNERIAQYRERVAGYWMNFTGKQKIMLGVAVALLILSVIVLTYLFSRTEYETVFQDLDAADTAAITEYLEGNNILYQLGPGGSSILVPSAVASKVRVDIGSQGLIQNGSIGFESFGNSSSTFGRTDNEFNVMYRNALNGEIQRLLNGMKGVQSSRVLVNLPEDTVFMTPGEPERASASINMQFKLGHTPSQAEVDGYFNLVKTAVRNLSVEDITITSEEGELFPSELSAGSGLATQPVDAQFQIQRKFEGELRKTIQSYLGRIYGGDRVNVSIISSLNFDQKNSTESLVVPLPDNNNNGIIISQAETNSSSTGSSGNSGGVVGTGETDVPGYQAADGSETMSSEDSSRTTNYEVSRVTNQIVSAPYQVKDLSISVGLATDTIAEESRNELNRYLTSIVVAQLRDSGQNVDDMNLMAQKVSIFAQPFVSPEEDAGSSGLSTAWMIGLGVLALALVGGAAYMIAARRRNRALAEEEEEQEELLEAAQVEYPTIDLENVGNESQVRKQLEQLAKRKPDEFVNLLRTWLVDE
ncbi:flagellar basal-body MS-ring/collar protein FliF [Paenibacillus daejeonensis]|uniref:flagellar basal-body MS-ring/collar protein FliF n=1 Tax=Paenibacillus daejeonensis TaxID=135193 RepID=UPI0003AB4499|nr:flagellar basal-body MS-ring/collar protein FliF [Paenibacillus daejeonensis]